MSHTLHFSCTTAPLLKSIKASSGEQGFWQGKHSFLHLQWWEKNTTMHFLKNVGDLSWQTVLLWYSPLVRHHLWPWTRQQVQSWQYSESTTQLTSTCFHTLILGQFNITADFTHTAVKTQCPLECWSNVQFQKMFWKCNSKDSTACCLTGAMQVVFTTICFFPKIQQLKCNYVKLTKEKITFLMLIQYPLRWLNVLDRCRPDNIQNQQLS
jgi:hypothetical protein